ncbi:MAG: HAMP domain-containing histidine kinase [Sedimentisphaerales bacterium]|nr:HAMP domain-containing histidine kinase [Sedimentisphaerales bacterium]
MYRRLLILFGIILGALAGLSWLGFRAIELQEEGLRNKREADFASVAERIRRDVKHKVDEFVATERRRDFAEYQPYYVREDVVAANDALAIFRSPLQDSLEQGLAYGHFQIDPQGRIVTPYFDQGPSHDQSVQARTYRRMIQERLLDSLSGVWTQPGGEILIAGQTAMDTNRILDAQNLQQDSAASGFTQQKRSAKLDDGGKGKLAGYADTLPNLQGKDQETQIFNRSRDIFEQNFMLNSGNQVDGSQQRQTTQEQQQETRQEPQTTQRPQRDRQQQMTTTAPAPQPPVLPPEPSVAPQADAQWQMQQGPQSAGPRQTTARMLAGALDALAEGSADAPRGHSLPQQERQEDLVQVRVEPFVQLLVADPNDTTGLFDGRIFLVRHVQIENTHYLQGFQLNEPALLAQVRESSERLIGPTMRYDLTRREDRQAAYNATILDFGLGELLLGLYETRPGWIGRQIRQLQWWYFGILAVVFLVVGLGIVSMWHNVREQMRLARKKDDFISAVSHELRTPLTSLRMYIEMLEKGWLKSDDKRAEYYRNMRQESERLSRLIENVLDFSRIQRNRKHYQFQAGDINDVVGKAVEMMRTCADQKGFCLETDFAEAVPAAFDRDAVMQIVINLVDNAVKYAGDAPDKRILIRTRSVDGYVLIEVEDHGPGVPHRQRRRIFDEFYRCEAETTRETAGSGLGLALVQRFAQAHDGFVEILTAHPQGALFRVHLARHG